MAVPMTSCMSLPMMATSVQSQSPILTLVGYLAWQTWVLLSIQCVATLGVTADLGQVEAGDGAQPRGQPLHHEAQHCGPQQHPEQPAQHWKYFLKTTDLVLQKVPSEGS